MATLLLVAPGTAVARNYTTPAAGIISAPSLSNPFSVDLRGLKLTAESVQDLTLVAPARETPAFPGTTRPLNLAFANDGKISISGTPSTIRTSREGALSATGAAAAGDIDIDVGDVSTSAYRTDGIDASTNQGGNAGNINIKAGNVSVSGYKSIGVYAKAYSGDVNVDLASAKASGDSGHAIIATSGFGNVSVNAGTVETSGTGGRAITAASAGTTTVTAGDISTTGQGGLSSFDSDGLMAIGTKVVVDITGTVSTSGDYAVGVYAHTNHLQSDPSIGNPDIDVTVGNVITRGFASDGIHVVDTAYRGNASVSAGTVTTSGDYAWGIYAASQHGNVAVTAGDTTTHGNYGTGIIALANGFVTVSARNITTTGDNATGLQTISGAASSLSGTTINVGAISTSGAYSLGIDARSYYRGSTIAIDAGTVSTSGASSNAISAVGAGSIGITANSVATSGNDSIGIYAFSEPTSTTQALGTVAVNANLVTTSGADSGGIVAIAAVPLASVAVDAKNVSTAGDRSVGIYAASLSGSVQVNTSGVSTKGMRADGIDAVSRYGNVTVTADHVEASGQSSHGIYAASDSGKVTVVASDIQASGNFSTALAAFGSSVDITTSGQIAAGFVGHGIVAQSRDGGIVLHNDGLVTTSYGGIDLVAKGLRSDIIVTGTGGVTKSGQLSHDGMGVLNLTGGDISVSQGDVSTTGIFSTGVVATVGNNSTSAARTNDTAHLLVELGNVSTDGFDALGVQLSNQAVTGVAGTGDATAIIHGTVSTRGAYSDGISVYSANDLAAAQSSIVTTAGDFSDAVHLDGHAVRMNAIGAITTSGNNALGIGAYGGNGGIRLTSGSITTTGIDSVGIRATSPGDMTIVGAGPIATSGDGSAGIQATEVARHRELSAYIPYSGFGAGHRAPETPLTGRTITVAASGITTTGADSDGLFVSGSTGMAKITTGTVSVNGMGSVGVFGEDKSIAADTGNTFSQNATAVELRAFDSASLNVRGTTISGNGDAVQLQGSNVDLTVAEAGKIEGLVNGVVIDATPHVTPVVAYWGQLPNYYYAPDQPIPPANPGPGKVVVSNAGTISAANGYAIKVTGGSASVTNSGLIHGRVLFSDGDDLLANRGIFDASGDSDFGAGTDLFQNTGTLRVLTGSAVAGHVSFLGLERFENDGTIDLRNGHSGDTLTLSGDFVGSNGSTLGLDVSPGKGATADQLMVAGAATGKTAIKLSVTGPDVPVLSNTPIALVKVGAGSTAGAFTLENPDIGFIRYGLGFDAASGTFGLTTSAGAPVYRTLNAAEGTGNIWNRSMDGWESHLAQSRDAAFEAASSRGRALWGQISDGSDTRDNLRDIAASGGGGTSYDLGYRQKYKTMQLGVDLPSTGRIAIGAIASYTSSDQRSQAAADRTHYKAFSLGAYASFHAGPAFASALAQYGEDWLKLDSPQLDWSARLKSRVYGGEIQTGVHFGSNRMFAEPLASFAYFHGELPALHALGQSIDFGQVNGLRGKLGARFGASVDLKGGLKALVYASAAAVHEFVPEQRATFLSGGSSASIRNEGAGTYGHGSVGIHLIPMGRVGGFIEAEGNTGHGFKGAGGRAGISVRF